MDDKVALKEITRQLHLENTLGDKVFVCSLQHTVFYIAYCQKVSNTFMHRCTIILALRTLCFKIFVLTNIVTLKQLGLNLERHFTSFL